MSQNNIISYYTIEKIFFDSLYPSLDGAAKKIITNILNHISVSPSNLSSREKHQLISYLDTFGYFSLRNSVTALYKALEISRTVVYNYLKTPYYSEVKSV